MTRTGHKRLFALWVAGLVCLLLCASFALYGCGGDEGADGGGEPAAEENPLPERPDVSEAVAQRIASMTPEQKAAQLFILTPEELTGVDVATLGGDKTKAALQSYPLGGLVYARQNLVAPEQTKIMLANTQNFAKTSAGFPIFLCVEEEGGAMAQVGGNPGFTIDNVGDMSTIGATGDTSIAERTAQSIGTYLRDLGFNMNFAPVANVGDNPDSPTMARRSYSSDARTAGKMVAAAVAGFERANIVSCAKHFPGIGNAVGHEDAGDMYSYESYDELAKSELIPFQDAIAAGVPCIMVGNISLPEVTGNDTIASLNPDIISGILRDKLHFDGVVITDSLSHVASDRLPAASEVGVAALEAGADMILMPGDFHAAYNGILNALNEGRLTEERLDESLTRILTVKLQYLS